MGQCNSSESDPHYVSNSQSTEQSTHYKQSVSQKVKVMWEHELNISHNFEIHWNDSYHQIHPCFQQISKDVTRTYPQSSFFGNKTNLDKLQKILKKIALYFPQMGYTQGLNFVGGFLLLSGCEQQQCCNLLVKLLAHERILAIGLYEDGFPLNKFYCQLFWILLQKKIPKVYQKLKKTCIQDQLWLFQWFLTFFFYNFSLEFARGVWDFIVSKKEIAPVLVALGIIRVLRNDIMKIDLIDEFDFIQYIDKFKDPQFCKKFLDLKKIFAFANSITKLQIDKAISQTVCPNNPYKIYYSSSLVNQKEQWNNLINKFDSERQIFNLSTEPKKYERSIDVIEHFQKMVALKYKLYQSQLKKSNGMYRRSNLSIPFSIRTSKTNNKQNFDFNKKRFI